MLSAEGILAKAAEPVYVSRTHGSATAGKRVTAQAPSGRIVVPEICDDGFLVVLMPLHSDVVM